MLVDEDVLPRAIIFEKHYLDFEPYYRKVGWKVRYGKSGFNQDHEAYWMFEKCK